MIGSKLGDYEILRLIGKGGMGAVYEAVKPSINRRVAIKVLLPEFAERDDVVRRFPNEAKAVNAVNHPGDQHRLAACGRPGGGACQVDHPPRSQAREGNSGERWASKRSAAARSSDKSPLARGSLRRGRLAGGARPDERPFQVRALPAAELHAGFISTVTELE